MTNSPRGPLSISDETKNNQTRAANPEANVWVKANAGSGKTYILSRRVLRLLIDGVPPEQVLCLTYTKAAAAEMRARVSKELGQWAVMDEEKLSNTIFELEGKRPDIGRMNFARQLFAKALETPGGLKINTIHAFSESILHRFPLEAGVPFDFQVIDDAERFDLLRAAREAVLAQRVGGDDLKTDIDTLFNIASDDGLESAISNALSFGAKLRIVLDNKTRCETNLRTFLGLSAIQNLTTISQETIDAAILPPSEYANVSAELTHLGVAKNFNKKLSKAVGEFISPDLMFRTFLKPDGTRPGKGHEAHSGVAKHNALLAEQLENETERLEALYQPFMAAKVLDQSLALLNVIEAIFTQYDTQKRARSLLDFDDLIIHLRQLLSDSEFSQWVAYKLDAGITHILVDESQDTNPEQWRIVEALLADFFDGESAIQRPRSVFAVGDEKQSIFSFQGAEPHLFGETGRKLGLQAMTAEKDWEDITLKTSFRTVGAILAAVDHVFERPFAHEGLTTDDEKTVHEAARTMGGGVVELWRPVEKPQIDENEEIYKTKASDPRSRPEDILADKIATTIQDWIETGRQLGARDQVVTPGDILILVQSRGPMFKAMIRALKQKGLPNLGEDKLTVSTHIAVEDLLVLADVLMNPADDLGLATLLRSPLFGWNEDQLFTLARGTRNGKCRMQDQKPVWPLWVQLQADAETDERAALAAQTIREWRNRLDLDRPYEFFAHVLFKEQGLKKFHARLGPEIDDVINEFLNMALAHEQTDQPSMLGFVTAMRQSESQIKRELSEASGAIRVMTVHGAKGLEAPIVFSIDATSSPAGQQNNKSILMEADHEAPQNAYLLWAPGSAKNQAANVQTGVEREKAKDQAEYRRKLYVALTRAEDELYVTGIAKRGQENSWYQMVYDGLAEHCLELKDEADQTIAWRYPKDAAFQVGKQNQLDDVKSSPLPNWITEPAPVPTTRRIVEPSKHDEVYKQSAGPASLDRETARLRGTTLHALLQFMPRFAPEDRHQFAAQALVSLMPDHEQLHDRMIEQANAIITAPEFADLFGTQSRGEVAVAADIEFEGKPSRITGRIDRLVVSDDQVLIVDFKSDANPPKDVDAIPANYRTQLTRYRAALRKQFPNRPINCAILWTENLKMSHLLDSNF
ncbi:double-strand break repair helicase AddA [Maritalea sp.]|uniref:double-strand break repair helicase AddA n=1 Tax=Maritalea sp. TaxID=2003361 RepID=UPI003EF7BB9F